ncbi:MAG: AAA family ATPase [Bacteroidetes bacterium]|nr:AAA family ATPase [Bacteroidota bacterium]
MISFAVYNLKGGVGKTSSCVNLAYLAAKDGFKTLLWDLDPQGASSFYLKNAKKPKTSVEKVLQKDQDLSGLVLETEYENLSLIPGNLKNRHLNVLLNDLKKSEKKFKRLLSSTKKSYDYLFIDCPPSINHLSEHIFKTANFILLPMIPTTLSERTYKQAFQHFEENKEDVRKIIPFFNLVDARKNMHKHTIARFHEDKIKCLKSTIPYSAVIEKMGIHQAPLETFSRRSKAAFSYKNLWQELKAFRKLAPLQSS